MAPQAYTKQILQEAFEWWSEQPENLRNQIQDSDDLVGYYLKVHRGQHDYERPEGFSKASKESFSSELKGLAEDLNTFEGYQEGVRHERNEQAKAALNFGLNPKPQQQQQKKMPRQNPQQLSLPTMTNQLAVPASTDAKPVQNVSGQFFKLDGRSLAMVKEAKELLNLSNDEEALRALISFGAQKFKNLLKP